VVEITIMGYQGNILLSTIIAPRTFVTINPSHLGFEEDDLMTGKDEFITMQEIRRITINKTIIGYDMKKTMRLYNIHTYAIHGYVYLERHELLRRKCGMFTNKIKLPQMAKKFNIKAKFPIRTAPRCTVLRQLWKKVERETLDVINVTHQCAEQDVLELQNQMEDEFTSIGRTPSRILRTLIEEAPRTQTPENRIPINKTIVTKIATPFTINTLPMKKM